MTHSVTVWLNASKQGLFILERVNYSILESTSWIELRFVTMTNASSIPSVPALIFTFPILVYIM